jgi:hypothetical protein
MRVERRITLTKKELEAMRTVYKMFDEDTYGLFDGAGDFIDFIHDITRYGQFQNYVVVEEN